MLSEVLSETLKFEKNQKKGSKKKEKWARKGSPSQGVQAGAPSLRIPRPGFYALADVRFLLRGDHPLPLVRLVRPLCSCQS